MKLIQGIEIKSSKSVEGEYNFVHYHENHFQIRSNLDMHHVLKNSILDKKLPGNLGSYIYPHDAIICLTNNSKMSKSVFKDIMKNANTDVERYNTGDLIFDVPNDCVEDPEEEEVENEELECESEGSLEEEDWQDEDDEEISDDHDENTDF